MWKRKASQLAIIFSSMPSSSVVNARKHMRMTYTKNRRVYNKFSKEITIIKLHLY
jgi:hypothetical protein